MSRHTSGASSVRPSTPAEVDVEVLELTFNAHPGRILSAINQTLQKESHLDVIILCEDQIIRAHKLMLAAGSGYFERVLDIVSNASYQVPVLLLPQSIKMFHVRKILDFIYTGDVTLPEEKLVSFCEAVKYLEVRGMGEICDYFPSTVGSGGSEAAERSDEDDATSASASSEDESSDEVLQPSKKRKISSQDDLDIQIVEDSGKQEETKVQSSKKRKSSSYDRPVTETAEDSEEQVGVTEPDIIPKVTVAPVQTSRNVPQTVQVSQRDERTEGDRRPSDSAVQEEEQSAAPKSIPDRIRPDLRQTHVEGPIWVGTTFEGKRLYFCNDCPYTSSGKTNAVRHGRVHTGDRPYACSLCSLAFSRQDGLTVHMRRAHEPRQHSQ